MKKYIFDLYIRL